MGTELTCWISVYHTAIKKQKKACKGLLCRRSISAQWLHDPLPSDFNSTSIYRDPKTMFLLLWCKGLVGMMATHSMVAVLTDAPIPSLSHPFQLLSCSVPQLEKYPLKVLQRRETADGSQVFHSILTVDLTPPPM